MYPLYTWYKLWLCQEFPLHYQYFLPEGPLAILPIKNNTASIVWTENAQNASIIAEMEYVKIISEKSAAHPIITIPKSSVNRRSKAL